MSSAGRTYRVSAAGAGCAAASLIWGPEFDAGWEADGLAPEPELAEE